MTDWAARYGWGAAWLRSHGLEVSENGARVAELVDWTWEGIYHLEGVERARWDGNHVTLRIWAPKHTSSLLTRLVIGAHDHAIRIGIGAASPHEVQITFWPRSRAKHSFESHPTIERRLETIERGFRFEDAPESAEAGATA